MTLQTDKLLEEGICDLQDKKEELARRMRRLETDMQDVRPHSSRAGSMDPVSSVEGSWGKCLVLWV